LDSAIFTWDPGISLVGSEANYQLIM